MKFFWVGALFLVIGAVGSGLAVYTANADKEVACASFIPGPPVESNQ